MKTALLSKTRHVPSRDALCRMNLALEAALKRLLAADEPYFLDAERSDINCGSDGKSTRLAELGKARNEARAALVPASR